MLCCATQGRRPPPKGASGEDSTGAVADTAEGRRADVGGAAEGCPNLRSGKEC